MAAAASKFAQIVATAFLAGGLCATHAFADTDLGTVDGLTYIQDSLTLGAAPAEAETTADCPPGTRLTGGGAAPSSSPFSETWINTILPVDGADAGSAPDGTRVRIANLAGGSKSGAAFAICTAGKVRTRSAKTRIDSSDSGAVRARCPAGRRVASGGAGLNSAAADSHLDTSYPFDGGDRDSKPDDGWKARAFNAGGTRARLQVSVQCVKQRLAYRDFFASAGGLIFAPCQAGGHALGGGIKADGAAGVGHMNTAYPYAQPTNPPDRGFVLAMGSTFGSGPSYTAHVICTRP